ncbi:MAG: diaminopimelate epimerase [Clostridia bacterium]
MVTFTKMHGLGNDYICINCLENILAENKLPQIARYMCNRNFGIGADGLILVQESTIADIKMRIFNKDGSEAEMCGNGIRCFAKYIYDNKIIDKQSISIETKAGVKGVRLKVLNGEVYEIEVDMGRPIFDDIKNISVQNNYRIPISVNIKVDDTRFIGNYVSMGNPHLVIFVNNVENIDIEKYGPAIENMKCFPNKINVEFVQALGRNTLKIRTWERGVGETYACGTGSCASFCIAYYKGICSSYVKAILRGGELNLNYNKQNGHIIMSGIATKVYDGNINI